MLSTKSGLISLSFLVALVGCGQSSDAPSGETKSAAGPAAAGCAFVSTKDDSPLVIKAVATDTPQAKEFLETCINPYTKVYAADAEAAKDGRKKFGYYSCTQCHGPNGDGQVAVSITDERWEYAKHVSDKGMFETIAGGTNNGMFAWHQQVSQNPELVNTDDILKMVAWLRTEYKGGGDTPWLN